MLIKPFPRIFNINLKFSINFSTKNLNQLNKAIKKLSASFKSDAKLINSVKNCLSGHYIYIVITISQQIESDFNSVI